MKHARRRRFAFAALISGPAVWWLLVLLIPYAIMFAISFYQSRFPSHVPDFQFDNYARVFAQTQYISVLLRSLKISILVSIVTFELSSAGRIQAVNRGKEDAVLH